MAWREATVDVVVPFEDVAQDGTVKPTAEGTYLDVGNEVIDLRMRGGMGSADFVKAHGVRQLGVWCASQPGPGNARPLQTHSLYTKRGLGWFTWRDGSRRHGSWEIHELMDRDGVLVARWDHKWLWFQLDDSGAMRFLDEPAPGIDEDQDIELPPINPRPTLAAPREAASFAWTMRETDLNQHVFYRSYLARTENVLAEAGIDVSALSHRQTWYLTSALLTDRMVGLVEEHDDHVLVSLGREHDGTVCTYARFDRP